MFARTMLDSCNDVRDLHDVLLGFSHFRRTTRRFGCPGSRGDLAAFVDDNEDVLMRASRGAAPESATDDLIRHLLVLSGWSSEWATALVGAIIGATLLSSATANGI